MNLTHAYGNVITPAIPPALWKLFPRLDDIPRKSFSRVEVHPIAFAKEPQGGMFCRKIIGSPEDGALAMCSVYLAHIDGHSVCVANLPDKEKALAYGHEIAAELGLSEPGGSMRMRKVLSVPGRGYLAARLSDGVQVFSFTFDPDKAAFYAPFFMDDPYLKKLVATGSTWCDWLGAPRLANDLPFEASRLLASTIKAVLGAMGDSAPPAGSVEAGRLYDAIKYSVETNRRDRLQVFDAETREWLVEQLTLRQYDIQGDENDEMICRMVSYDQWLLEDLDVDATRALLDSFASDAGVAAMTAAVGFYDQSPLPRNHLLRQVHALLEAGDGGSPFESFFANEADVEHAATPRG